MRNILNSYIPKFLVDLNRKNDDVVTVTTRYFSQNEDVYELDERTIAPVMVQTTQSIQELRPEISNTYPFKTITHLDYDGVTVIITPAVDTIPTASQGYYAPIYFERYNTTVMNNIDTTFTELTVENLFTDETGSM